MREMTHHTSRNRRRGGRGRRRWRGKRRRWGSEGRRLETGRSPSSPRSRRTPPEWLPAPQLSPLPPAPPSSPSDLHHHHNAPPFSPLPLPQPPPPPPPPTAGTKLLFSSSSRFNTSGSHSGIGNDVFWPYAFLPGLRRSLLLSVFFFWVWIFLFQPTLLAGPFVSQSHWTTGPLLVLRRRETEAVRLSTFF